MTYLYLNAKLIMDMLCQMLSGIHTTVLSARTTEREHQTRKATLDITTHMGISEFIDGIKEGQYLTIILQKADDRLV
jgi:hypothetical protein